MAQLVINESQYRHLSRHFFSSKEDEEVPQEEDLGSPQDDESSSSAAETLHSDDEGSLLSDEELAAAYAAAPRQRLAGAGEPQEDEDEATTRRIQVVLPAVHTATPSTARGSSASPGPTAWTACPPRNSRSFGSFLGDGPSRRCPGLSEGLHAL